MHDAPGDKDAFRGVGGICQDGEKGRNWERELGKQ